MIGPSIFYASNECNFRLTNVSYVHDFTSLPSDIASINGEPLYFLDKFSFTILTLHCLIASIKVHLA